ncbi:hypothetical protein B0H15DRAFT_289488 [Mycena belliarum]|uniref:Uncharacterized protein n=1 Tax=Mycena belliarum TaxID=1033014 RepID=A0AAD6U7J2_9AGAR|nr:hypothetical protein B0H15DRAFT_289488 [Mycena belliae]
MGRAAVSAARARRSGLAHGAPLLHASARAHGAEDHPHADLLAARAYPLPPRFSRTPLPPLASPRLHSPPRARCTRAQLDEAHPSNGARRGLGGSSRQIARAPCRAGPVSPSPSPPPPPPPSRALCASAARARSSPTRLSRACPGCDAASPVRGARPAYTTPPTRAAHRCDCDRARGAGSSAPAASRKRRRTQLRILSQSIHPHRSFYPKLLENPESWPNALAAVRARRDTSARVFKRWIRGFWE